MSLSMGPPMATENTDAKTEATETEVKTEAADEEEDAGALEAAAVDVTAPPPSGMTRL